MMNVELLRLPMTRVLRTRASWISMGGWCALSWALALAVRGGGLDGLMRLVSGLAIPLSALTLTGSALGGTGLRKATDSLVFFGASRKGAALSLVLFAAVASAIACTFLCVVAAFVAQPLGAPGAIREIAGSSYAGLLSGAAYAGYFAVGSCLGKRGGGRTAFLFADFIMGQGYGGLAVVFPRSHVRSLFGGVPPLELSQKASSLGLVVILALSAILVSFRAHRMTPR